MRMRLSEEWDCQMRMSVSIYIPYTLHPDSHCTHILDYPEKTSVFDNLKSACNIYKHSYPVPYTLILDYMIMSLEPKTCALNGSWGSYSSWIRVYGRGYMFSCIVIYFPYTHENIDKMYIVLAYEKIDQMYVLSNVCGMTHLTCETCI